MTGASVYIVNQIAYRWRDTNNLFMEVEIMTRISMCLVDTIVLGATWYTMGSMYRLARRTQTAVSLTRFLLIDGKHRCCKTTPMPSDWTLSGTAHLW